MIGHKATNVWGKVRVGDALRLINGRAFKPSEWKEKGLPIVRIQNLNNAEAPFNYYEGNLPEKFLLDSGDLLFAWSGTPGTSFGAHIWRGGKAWLNQHIFKVIFDEAEFDKRFLRLAINQNLNQYIQAAHGAAGLAHITKGMFEQSELIKPTLDEQRNIVAEIEKQFSRLDEAVASLKRTKANLKRYKAAVLKAAVEGKLTEDWRNQHPDIEPANKLLERILAERRAKSSGKGKNKESPAPDTSNLPALPKGWIWTQMDAVCEKIQDGTHFSPKEQSATGDFKYITAKNIKPWGLDLSELTYVSERVHRGIYSRCNPKKGDVLLIKDGVTTGIATVNPLDEEFSLLSSVALLKPVRTALDSHYLKNWLNSPAGYRATTGKMTGTAIKRIILEKIKEAPVPLPPLVEQQRVVAEVERRLSVIDELVSTVEANLTRADRLRQAVLTCAFSGRLVDGNKTTVNSDRQIRGTELAETSPF